jgi:hypothetical protein
VEKKRNNNLPSPQQKKHIKLKIEEDAQCAQDEYECPETYKRIKTLMTEDQEKKMIDGIISADPVIISQLKELLKYNDKLILN